MAASKGEFPDYDRQAEANAFSAGGSDQSALAGGELEPVAGQDLPKILHGLNNSLVSILLNAQIIEWKLPSYSRLKRNVHEIERSAQRAAVLVKRLRPGREVDEGGAPAPRDLPSDTATQDSPRSEANEAVTPALAHAAEGNECIGTGNRKKVPHTMV